jgi:adenylate cyclase
VDKFIGDAIMAVFGAPNTGENDAAAAIRAAEGMRRALIEHNMVRAEWGLEPLRQGVGVHFGEVVAGNMGAQDRMSYTVLGDTVNAASRLESSTKKLGVEVILSKEVVDAARKGNPGELPTFKEIGELALRGKEQGLKVYTLD